MGTSFQYSLMRIYTRLITSDIFVKANIYEGRVTPKRCEGGSAFATGRSVQGAGGCDPSPHPAAADGGGGLRLRHPRNAEDPAGEGITASRVPPAHRAGDGSPRRSVGALQPVQVGRSDRRDDRRRDDTRAGTCGVASKGRWPLRAENWLLRA